MKKFIFILLVVLLSSPLFAQQQKRRIIDDAGLLTDPEVSELEKRAEELALAYNFDLIIVTKTSLGGANAVNFADDYFDNNNYGFGEDRSGCLLLQVTEDRDYVFSTSGKAINILDKNNYAFDKLEKDVVSYLRNNNPAGAYRAYFDLWEKFLVLDKKGLSYNFIQVWNFPIIIIIWVFALIIALYTVSLWKKGMNIFIPAKQADSYVISQSLSYSTKKDTFLYSNVSKIRRETNTSSFGSGGGGLRTGSSGRIHGGRSGKY